MATAGALPWLATMLAATVVAAAAVAADDHDDSRVTTSSGDLIGARLQSFLGNIYVSFKGIPYAEPPLRELRFRASQPHAGWSGVRNAKTHGSKCLQYSQFFPGVVEGSEDCLFINVYTPQLPAKDSRSQLPVMVWIHGGGFTTGSGDADIFGPDYLMDQQDVVVITFNYRLGAFGFLTTADASAPGNYGLHDQVLALEWVQANVAAFGGDPNAVTIFGESAGGSSVGLLMLSSRARGLFTKAISQSGASFCSFAVSGEPQGQTAIKQAKLLGCTTSNSREIVGCMRKKPAKEILKSIEVIMQEDPIQPISTYYKPRVDLESHIPILAEDPFVALKAGRFNTVPWMMGLMRDEGAFYTAKLRGSVDAMSVCGGRDWSRWASSVMQISGVVENATGAAEHIHRHYFGDTICDEDNLQPLTDLLSDRFFTACVTSEADLSSAHTPVYMYMLDFDGPGRQSLLQVLAKLTGKLENYRDLGVPHAEDVQYLFRPMLVAPFKADSNEYKMIRFIVSLWTGFARRGYPSTDVLNMPSWPIYVAGRQEHMRLNMAPSVDKAAFSERVQFWKQLNIAEGWRLPLVTEASHDEL